MVIQKMSNKKGFTLIELLVVVAIIAILAAIAIPQYNKYRSNAMLSNVQQLTKSIASQAASLATTAGQNPSCSSASEFAVKQNGDYLEAYTWDGSNVGSTVCDKVKLYDTQPGWIATNGIEVKGSNGNNDYLILTNSGTNVTFDGYVAVKSTYKLGTNKHFGCKYENGELTDYDNSTYFCHIE